MGLGASEGTRDSRGLYHGGATVLRLSHAGVRRQNLLDKLALELREDLVHLS
jgi:hypothetical protein